MADPDLSLLEEVGLLPYDRRALAALSVLGVADAAGLCRHGDIPTSKIYLTMEKLAALGLCEVQRTRPKLYAALPPDVVVDRLIELMRERADLFAAKSVALRTALLAQPSKARQHRTTVDLAIGTASHVKRHLSRLATAKTEVVSYLEEGDLAAINQLAEDGFNILKRVARAARETPIQHRVIFGFSNATAPRLVQFLRTHEKALAHLSGVRFSGEMGHPFHVLDGEIVILPLDHPFVPEGRFASLLIRDPTLANSLVTGFESLWRRSLESLREVKFYPRQVRGAGSRRKDQREN
jgi:sugar-specific transcriptional regulator TrmB